jgi:hypothetical protein
MMQNEQPDGNDDSLRYTVVSLRSPALMSLSHQSLRPRTGFFAKLKQWFVCCNQDEDLVFANDSLELSVLRTNIPSNNSSPSISLS